MFQGIRFLGPELEEARACYFALKTVFSHGVRSIILEGDCKSLITKLKRKCIVAAEVGLFITDILQFSYLFDYCAFKFVKREGNRVVHHLAHLQPYDQSTRIWLDDVPDYIFNLALGDYCKLFMVA